MADEQQTNARDCYTRSDAALQQAMQAIVALSRSMDPKRSVRPRAEDLRHARLHLAAAADLINDAIGALNV